VAVFGEHLVLSRRVSITYGSGVVRVEDLITNQGYAVSPLAVMYHVNVGWPVVAPSARIDVGGSRLQGIGDNTTVRIPSADAEERTWVHSPRPGADGRSHAFVTNSSVDEDSSAGMRLSWEADALPTLVQWEIAGVAGHVAVALEPSTMRSDGDEMSFPELAPGESARLGVEIELLHGRAGADLTKEEGKP
jgi:hypothetical protein